jgi:ParB/RepB/Spo0J family partition protein
MTANIRKLIYLSPEEIKPNPKNPRKHDRAQIQALAKSVQAFEFNAPILLDRYKQIVAGHARWQAARLLKFALVPVILLDDLNDAQAQAYMLADNKLTDRSSWDEPLLAAHLKELSELAIDFDIEATGFEKPEVDFRTLCLDNPGDDAADDFEYAKGRPTTTGGTFGF